MTPEDFARLTTNPARIVMAPIVPMDPNGEIKIRPVVLLTRPETNLPEADFLVMAGSTSPPNDTQVPYAIMAKGKDSPRGHPATGLTRDTWFYATWIRSVTVSQVVEFKKFFPDYEIPRLRLILQEIERSKS